MKLEIKPLSQRNDEWRRFLLGDGVVTIGGYGCVLLCVDMMLQYFGKDIWPKALNDAMKTVGGWVGPTKNLWNWKALEKLYDDIRWIGRHDFGNNPADLSILNDQLDKKQPVILRVEADEIGAPKSDHFVLCIGRDGDDYWIADPYFGDIVRLGDRYKNLGSSKPEHVILGYRIYEGPLDSAPEDKDAERAIEQLKNHLPEFKKKVGESKAHLESMSRSFIDRDKKDTTVKKEYEELLKTQKAQYIKQLSDKDTNWQVKLKTANQKLENAVKIALEQSETKVLFKSWLVSLFGISEGGEKSE